MDCRNIAQVIKIVVRINVPKEELMRRLIIRGRADDTKEVIEERFRITEQNIYSVCEILATKELRLWILMVRAHQRKFLQG